MNVSYVCFEEKEKAVLKTEPFDPALAGNRVLVKNDFDVISAGTELANYHALPNTGGAFPRYPGYSVAGHVEAVGPEVKTLKKGDRVIVHWCGHRSRFIKPEDELLKIPDGVDQAEASFAHLCSFPFLGVRKLNIQLGESVMVAGLGILGLFAVQIARLAGAYPVLGCDFSAERRAMALKLGADFVFDPSEPDFIEKVKAVTDGKGPDGVVEVTGYISALQQALEYIAWQGRITLLGCTRISDRTIDYYQYVHRRGIQLIGCHTFTRPKFESRPGQWTEMDDYRTFLKFVAAKRLQVAPVITERVSPRDASAVYHELGNSKNPPFGVLFDWRDFE